MLMKNKGATMPNISCRECATNVEPTTRNQVFCSQICNTMWTKRRQKRGLMLYDTFMELRYNRAGAGGLWTLMCRLAEEWRAEDARIRPGLKSWQDPQRIIRKRVYLIGKRGRI